MMTQSYLPDSTSIPPDSALRDIQVEFKRSWFMSTMRSVTQSCLTLCNPTDSSPPGSFVHGDSPGKNAGVGCHALLRGIFPTQGLNPGLPHCRWILYCLSHQVSSVGCSNKLANPGRGSWEPLIYIWSVRIIRSNLGLEKGVWIGNSLVALSF